MKTISFLVFLVMLFSSPAGAAQSCRATLEKRYKLGVAAEKDAASNKAVSTCSKELDRHEAGLQELGWRMLRHCDTVKSKGNVERCRLDAFWYLRWFFE